MIAHMAAAETAAFGSWLRGELKSRGWGVRTLARLMNPENPEVPRRALNHYMRGSLPTEPNAAAIAKALGIPRSELPIEEGAPLGEPFPAGLGTDVRAGNGAGRGARGGANPRAARQVRDAA